MPLDAELTLERAAAAIDQQAWREAWALLDAIDPDQRDMGHRRLGSLREDLEVLAAACLLKRGDVEDAERLYRSLLRLAPSDPRLPDVVAGLADAIHRRGDFRPAASLAFAAWRMPITDPDQGVRVAANALHIDSHINIDRATLGYQRLFEQTPASPTPLWASVIFGYADALLVSGQFEAALARLRESQDLAAQTGAAVTLADTMRRLPLVRILLGQQDYAMRGVGDLAKAGKLYEAVGDLGSSYLHTEAGEVYRSIGRWREAEKAFTRGLYASQDIDDDNRVAHNCLGVFELGRSTGSVKIERWDQAMSAYRKISSDWGIVHAHIARALADRGEHTKRLAAAREFAQASMFSRFEREIAFIDRLSALGFDQAARQPHIMNYP